MDTRKRVDSMLLLYIQLMSAFYQPRDLDLLVKGSYLDLPSSCFLFTFVKVLLPLSIGNTSVREVRQQNRFA